MQDYLNLAKLSQKKMKESALDDVTKGSISSPSFFVEGHKKNSNFSRSLKNRLNKLLFIELYKSLFSTNKRMNLLDWSPIKTEIRIRQ